MKNIFLKITFAILLISSIIGCVKTNYPGGVVSPYIGLYDVRSIFKGKPIQLNVQSLGGSSKIAVTVISDHQADNLPKDLLIVQDKRRLNFNRGIAINIGSDAKTYVPGDSLIIDIEGSTLDRVDGILQIKNITNNKISKVASDRPVAVTLTNTARIAANPDHFESTLVALVKAGVGYTPKEGQVISGDFEINDGFGTINVQTDPNSPIAKLPQLRMANYFGIIFIKKDGDKLVPYHRLRSSKALIELKSVYKTPKVIITGWMNDPAGSDSNHEYMQFMSTEDIDFSKTPMSVVTNNNATRARPTGVPQKGWATGGMRTYKFDLTKGKVQKGKLFYVGGSNKLINGNGSTSIKDANWIQSYDYSKNNGFDFGNRTSNLLANSGFAYGIAIFEGTKIDDKSIPEDVVFVATGGSLYADNKGYRIANTDVYDIINPLTLEEQPFYRSGTNTNAHTYNTPANLGHFNYMGGEYNLTLGRWTKVRVKHNPILTKQSLLSEIEDPEYLTKLVE